MMNLIKNQIIQTQTNLNVNANSWDVAWTNISKDMKTLVNNFLDKAFVPIFLANKIFLQKHIKNHTIYCVINL